MKLKDMKYQIQGVDSPRPALDCLQAIAFGMAFPVVAAVIFRLVNFIVTGS